MFHFLQSSTIYTSISVSYTRFRLPSSSEQGQLTPMYCLFDLLHTIYRASFWIHRLQNKPFASMSHK